MTNSFHPPPPPSQPPDTHSQYTLWEWDTTSCAIIYSHHFLSCGMLLSKVGETHFVTVFVHIFKKSLTWARPYDIGLAVCNCWNSVLRSTEIYWKGKHICEPQCRTSATYYSSVIFFLTRHILANWTVNYVTRLQKLWMVMDQDRYYWTDSKDACCSRGVMLLFKWPEY